MCIQQSLTRRDSAPFVKPIRGILKGSLKYLSDSFSYNLTSIRLNLEIQLTIKMSEKTERRFGVILHGIIIK